MRNFLVAKLRCAKCGEPLEIKLQDEVSDSVKHHECPIDDNLTGAAKATYGIFVQPCIYCQHQLERPARMILEGLKKLQDTKGDA